MSHLANHGGGVVVVAIAAVEPLHRVPLHPPLLLLTPGARRSSGP